MLEISQWKCTFLPLMVVVVVVVLSSSPSFERCKMRTLFSHISFPHETYASVCALC